MATLHRYAFPWILPLLLGCIGAAGVGHLLGKAAANIDHPIPLEAAQ